MRETDTLNACDIVNQIQSKPWIMTAKDGYADDGFKSDSHHWRIDAKMDG